jgi:hypothetical protein
MNGVFRRVPITASPGQTMLRGLVAGLLLAGCLLTPEASGAARPVGRWQAADSTREANARVRFEVLGTHRERPTGWPQAETHATLGVGETVTRYLTAGRGEAPDICEAGFINDPASVRPAYFWQLDARVLAVTAATTTVQLRWRRSQAHQGSMQEEAGDTRTLTLGLGEFQNFDYVGAPAGSSSDCSNLLLRLLVDPLPLADPQPLVTMDLWLAHDRSGRRRWVHQQVSGRSGQLVTFRLDPLMWSPAGTPIDKESPGPGIGMGVQGTAVATVRPEGFVDVSVQAKRSLTWGRARLDGEGQQDFRCDVNEAVALLFPDATGQAVAPAAMGGVEMAPGVFNHDDKTVVDFARFFAGSDAALYVVVHRR